MGNEVNLSVTISETATSGGECTRLVIELSTFGCFGTPRQLFGRRFLGVSVASR